MHRLFSLHRFKIIVLWPYSSTTIIILLLWLIYLCMENYLEFLIVYSRSLQISMSKENDTGAIIAQSIPFSLNFWKRLLGIMAKDNLGIIYSVYWYTYKRSTCEWNDQTWGIISFAIVNTKRISSIPVLHKFTHSINRIHLLRNDHNLCCLLSFFPLWYIIFFLPC